ncbi:class IIb bacteriocin, lactobin A/cerein 7B family [Listeria monocytogenes]|uniref:Blp family class II bacteriocin n=1 Tax=Listeria monocytogenes TaxID=1639 RepID=UPI0010DAD2DB|nr:Blp family class II bacteriocin [Listeria monocytogenes]EAE0903712.1 class IIb bacteriocin, lactobin A/cerein 7B family [Listeria monocytogenes]EAE0903931.1 class IIb bacteriocin, lactobin A/cerein 7B family [Listeria monocytogenes]TYU82791.1 class IIb bacteriocin, lactobin A/cerein 7B family [Listeria monocytogenes]
METIMNFKELTSTDLEMIDGGKTNIAQCYAGTIGSAVLGFGTMGPLGYWAGAAVGYATFC